MFSYTKIETEDNITGFFILQHQLSITFKSVKGKLKRNGKHDWQ